MMVKGEQTWNWSLLQFACEMEEFLSLDGIYYFNLVSKQVAREKNIPQPILT